MRLETELNDNEFEMTYQRFHDEKTGIPFYMLVEREKSDGVDYNELEKRHEDFLKLWSSDKVFYYTEKQIIHEGEIILEYPLGVPDRWRKRSNVYEFTPEGILLSLL